MAATFSAAPCEEFAVRFVPARWSGYDTGALDISLRDRRVISLPSQLGCRIGCTFCISRDTPVIRNLRAMEMKAMVMSCLARRPADGRPIELSFTGEGESVLNWKAAAEVCEELRFISADFDSVRYSFSGIGASTLLPRLTGGDLPLRLQFSLHAARQSVRETLVPRSEQLPSILRALEGQASRVASIELNVVLQDGVNDSGLDIDALAAWGDPNWPILMNPLLGDGHARLSARSDLFAERLISRGRTVKRYQRIGMEISTAGLYPKLTAKPVVEAPVSTRHAPEVLA